MVNNIEAVSEKFHKTSTCMSDGSGNNAEQSQGMANASVIL